MRLFDFGVPTIEQPVGVNSQHNTGTYIVIGPIDKAQSISDVPRLLSFVAKLWIVLMDIQGEERSVNGGVSVNHLFK